MVDERKEFDLIRRLFAPLAASRPEALGLLDDAAILSSHRDEQKVITTDCLVEGVHFRTDDPPGAVAARALRSNLSDLAAMGARPDCYTLALALPRSCTDAWLGAFVRQLEQDQKTYGIDLIGGDTVSTPGPTTITVTAIGNIEGYSAIRRSTASDGDDIYVSGYIGDAVLGLSVLNSGQTALSQSDQDYLRDRFWYPTPRIALGFSLRGSATAMSDVSDGLLADLGHICDASGLKAAVFIDTVPLSSPAINALSMASSSPDMSVTTLLTGGDDYELVFTAPPSLRESIQQIARQADTPVKKIGAVKKANPSDSSPPVCLIDKDGNHLNIEGAGGYEHQW